MSVGLGKWLSSEYSPIFVKYLIASRANGTETSLQGKFPCASARRKSSTSSVSSSIARITPSGALMATFDWSFEAGNRGTERSGLGFFAGSPPPLGIHEFVTTGPLHHSRLSALSNSRASARSRASRATRLITAPFISSHTPKILVSLAKVWTDFTSVFSMVRAPRSCLSAAILQVRWIYLPLQSVPATCRSIRVSN